MNRLAEQRRSAAQRAALGEGEAGLICGPGHSKHAVGCGQRGILNLGDAHGPGLVDLGFLRLRSLCQTEQRAGR